MNYLPWVNLLPESWQTKPLRAISSYAISNVDKVSADNETPVRLCNYAEVYGNDFITLGLDFLRATATDDEIDKFRVVVDDVLITKDSESSDDIGVPSLVKETADDLLCGYHLALLRPHRDQLAGAYLFRCLQAKSIRMQLELAANGVTRFGLPKTSIGGIRLPVPPLFEQRAIVAYLDRATERLDRLIAQKARILRLLEEKRRTVITHIVTRGLDPGVRFRDSGIPWLGKIPAHWEVERARWLFRERDERTSTGEEELLTVSHLTGVTPRAEKDVNMFLAETMEGYKMVSAGDLVINTLWAWMGAMGVSPVDGIVSPAYNVYRPTERFDAGYVDALVRSPLFAQEVTRYSKGVWSSRLRLYPEEFFNVVFPVPPRGEQTRIVASLDRELRTIGDLRIAAKKTAALLKERRAALIAAAVTGQLDIRSVE